MKIRRVKDRLKMVCAPYYLPKDNKSKPEGEDAHFACMQEQTIGVADGVGGWAERSIDAGEYARELMMNSFFALHKNPKEKEPRKVEGVDPKRVLHDAFSVTESKGSCTACIITHKDGVLRAANVGDSGFMLFRKNKLVYRSPVQQRGFNCPYQLGNNKNSDKPECAIEIKVEVMEGDVIILGTDGFFDNVFASEAEEVLERESRKKGGIVPKNLACYIAELALYNSFDRFRESPFSRNAKLAGKNRRGGKIDDITVIVSQIVAVDS